jgi:hypothetical protein
MSNFLFILMAIFTVAAVCEMVSVSNSTERRFCFIAIICLGMAVGFRLLSSPISDGIYNATEKVEGSEIKKWIAVPDTQLEPCDEIIWRVRWTQRDKDGNLLFASAFEVGDSHKNEIQAKLLAKSMNEDEILPTEVDRNFESGEWSHDFMENS